MALPRRPSTAAFTAATLHPAAPGARATNSRRLLLQSALAAGLVGPQISRAQTNPTGSAAADPWPSRPIRLIVPYAAGGSADIRARQIASRLTQVLGQNVLVDNKPGAGGVLGTDLVAKAPADGYTLGVGNLAPLSVNPSLMKSVPYDPIKDLAPIILIESSPLTLTVGPALAGVGNLKELIALAKSQPGRLSFASSGVGGAHHLSGELFKEQAGIDIAHVPYKGGAPASTDLMAGHVSMMFEMGYAALPSVKAGRIRALAVTSSKRLPVLPDVPTMSEAGLPGFESYNWQGLIAPARTPAAILERINHEVNRMIHGGDLRELINSAGSQASGGTSAQFASLIRDEQAKWAQVIQRAGIKAE